MKTVQHRERRVRRLLVSCGEGHLMTEANTYQATIGGYPRRFCRTCKRGRKAGDKMLARQRALDKTNPTFPCGHSARSDGGNKWVHAGRYTGRSAKAHTGRHLPSSLALPYLAPKIGVTR